MSPAARVTAGADAAGGAADLIDALREADREARKLARAAARAGVSWVILQPPPVAGLREFYF